MAYFENAKEGDRVECKIYGKGEIIMVCPECKYALMVTFDDGTDIPYSIDGRPAIEDQHEQTLYFEGKVEK